MLTIRKLIGALQQLQVRAESDQKIIDAPVRVVTQALQVEQGALEGAILLRNKVVVGLAISGEGVFMFTQEEGEELENFISELPSGFNTGNSDLNDRLKGTEPGEEWKNA